jgi:hypothetical protein
MQIHHLMSLAVDNSAGPGPVMRIVLVGSVVGVVLLAWFVLCGYGKNDGSCPPPHTVGAAPRRRPRSRSARVSGSVARTGCGR